MADFIPYKLNPKDVLPDTKVPPYPAGLYDGDKSIVRYAQPSLTTPTLTIIDTLYNIDNEPIVLPGHYELMLSEGMDFLMIVQSKKVLVTFPVFKLERDEEAIQKKYEESLKKAKWYQFRKRRLAQKLEKKLRDKGINPDKDKFVYNNATIEWIDDGSYYLIMYESGNIRAWGAIKQYSQF